MANSKYYIQPEQFSRDDAIKTQKHLADMARRDERYCDLDLYYRGFIISDIVTILNEDAVLTADEAGRWMKWYDSEEPERVERRQKTTQWRDMLVETMAQEDPLCGGDERVPDAVVRSIETEHTKPSSMWRNLLPYQAAGDLLSVDEDGHWVVSAKTIWGESRTGSLRGVFHKKMPNSSELKQELDHGKDHPADPTSSPWQDVKEEKEPRKKSKPHQDQTAQIIVNGQPLTLIPNQTINIDATGPRLKVTKQPTNPTPEKGRKEAAPTSSPWQDVREERDPHKTSNIFQLNEEMRRRPACPSSSRRQDGQQETAGREKSNVFQHQTYRNVVCGLPPSMVEHGIDVVQEDRGRRAAGRLERHNAVRGSTRTPSLESRFASHRSGNLRR